MAEVNWTKQALQDIDNIAEFIATVHHSKRLLANNPAIK